MGQLLINVSVDQESERLSSKQSQSTTPQLPHCPMPNRQALYSKLSTMPKTYPVLANCIHHFSCWHL